MGSLSKSAEETRKHEVELVFLEHAEFPDGPQIRIRRDILQQEGPWLQETRIDPNLILRALRLVVMGQNRHQRPIKGTVGYADDQAGRTFPSMPKSNNQTSPRAGVILFSVKHSKDLVGGASGLLVIQRTRIERNRPAQEFHGESPLFLFRERLERFQKLVCLPAQISLVRFTGQVRKASASAKLIDSGSQRRQAVPVRPMSATGVSGVRRFTDE